MSNDNIKEDVLLDEQFESTDIKKTEDIIPTSKQAFFENNLKFLSGAPAPNQAVQNPPIFRLAIILSSSPTGIAKQIHHPTSTDPSQINNIPSDYANIIEEGVNNNYSLFCLDFTFKWTRSAENVHFLKPEWQPINSMTPTDETLKVTEIEGMEALKNHQMGVFNIVPKIIKGKASYDTSVLLTNFWTALDQSYHTAMIKTPKQEIYTVWFQNDVYGYNRLASLFNGTAYQQQCKDLLDHFQKNVVVDLYSLSDQITPDKFGNTNKVKDFFNKWLFYKNTTLMTTNVNAWNKKEDTNKTEVTFNRLDDFFYHLSHCFINILDQILYENQKSNNNLQLADVFKDYRLISSKKTTVIDDEIDDKPVKKQTKKVVKSSVKKPSKTTKTKTRGGR